MEKNSDGIGHRHFKANDPPRPRGREPGVRRPVVGNKSRLWIGAGITAPAAIFFPTIEGIRSDDESWWRLLTFFVPQDTEGVILVPLVVALTIAVFGLLGRWAWNDPDAQNRPARVGLICGGRRRRRSVRDRRRHLGVRVRAFDLVHAALLLRCGRRICVRSISSTR